jgi:hypothetical protein
MSSTAKKMRGCRDESSCGDPPMGSGRGPAGVLAQLDLDARGFQTSPMFTDSPVGIVMTAARQQGLEGVIAKPVNSVFQGSAIPGVDQDPAMEVVIVWAASTGNEQVLGSLLLGATTLRGT